MSSKQVLFKLLFFIPAVLAVAFLLVWLLRDDPFVPIGKITVVIEGLENDHEYVLELAIENIKFSSPPLICYKISDENGIVRIDFWIFKEEPDEKSKEQYQASGFKLRKSRVSVRNRGVYSAVFPLEEMGFKGTDIYINGKINTGRITISPINSAEPNFDTPESESDSEKNQDS